MLRLSDEPRSAGAAVVTRLLLTASEQHRAILTPVLLLTQTLIVGNLVCKQSIVLHGSHDSCLALMQHPEVL